VATAVGAGLLARYTRYEDREEVFVAGLLHDVGKLVMFHFLPKEFVQVLEMARSEDIAIRAAEQRLLGFTHDQVGRMLAELWTLPVRLGEAIGCHHRPDLAQTAKHQAAIVHAADVLARASGLGSGGDDAVPAVEEDVWRRIALPATAMEALLDEMEEQYEQMRAILLSSMDGRTRRPAGVAHVA